MTLRKITIGRSTECDFVLPDSTVSRRHAELEILDDNRLLLTDYESTHGTFLIKNGKEQRINQQLITKYDVLRFGKTKIPVSEILAACHFHEQEVYAPQFNTNQPPPNYNNQNFNVNSQSIEATRPKEMSFGDLYFSFDGRVSCSVYWKKLLIPYFLCLLVIFLFGYDANTPSPIPLSDNALIFYFIFSIIYIIPSFSMTVKRCHDRNKSGWFLFIVLIPVIGGLWFFIETYFISGTRGANKYGPDPLR